MPAASTGAVQAWRLPELRPWQCLLLIVAVGTAFSLPMLIWGISHGMSHLYNISWTYEFNRLFRAGVLYPRWMDGLNNGVGSLAFWIYAPLPFFVNALSGGLLCSGCAPTTQVAIGEWLLLLGSGLAFFKLAREQAGLWPALVGSVFYMLAPYHFEIDLWRRQAIGEFAAYVFMPLVVLYFQRSVAGGGPRSLAAGALAYAALVLSHLPAAVLFSLSLPLLALFHLRAQPWWRPFAILAGMVLLGLGLASIYLLPALSIQAIDIYSHTGFHPWHYYANWFFLDGRDAPDQEFNGRLTAIWLGNTIAAMLLFVAARGSGGAGRQRELWWWLTACALVAFMVTAPSRFVWELLPFLQQVQFPWRIMVVTDLALAMLGVYALDVLLRSPTRLRYQLVAVAAAVLVVIGLGDWRAFKNISLFYGPQEGILDARALKVGTDTPEYMPMWVQIDQSELVKRVESLPQVSLIAGEGSATVQRWDNRHLVFDVQLAAPATLLVKQVYVPWWQGHIEGTSAGDTVALSPAPETGLLTVKAPAGHYALSLILGTPPVERTARSVSAVALAVLLCLAFWGRRWRRNAAGRTPAASPSAT